MILFIPITGIGTISLSWAMFRKQERWFNIDRWQWQQMELQRHRWNFSSR